MMTNEKIVKSVETKKKEAKMRKEKAYPILQEADISICEKTIKDETYKKNIETYFNKYSVFSDIDGKDYNMQAAEDIASAQQARSTLR